MRKEVAIVIGAVIALGAGVCPAVTFSTWDEGALRLELQIDPATRQAWLVDRNSSEGEGGPVDLMLDVDGLTITSTAGNLLPTLTWNSTTKTVTNGWFAIANSISKAFVQTIEALGEDVAGFGRLTQTAYNCTEVNISGYATFIAGFIDQPDLFPMTYRWSIGKPVSQGLSWSTLHADIGFLYHTPTGGVNNWFQGSVNILPEPGCAAGLLAGLAAVVRRRRRR